MSNERTTRLRRRYHNALFIAAVALAVAITGARVVTLGHRDNFLMPLILTAGIVFYYAARRTYAYRAELKRTGLIDNQKAYGGGNEFAETDTLPPPGSNDNIWGR